MRIVSRVKRSMAGITIIGLAVFAGCNDAAGPTGAPVLASSPMLSDVVSGPISASELESVLAVMSSLPEENRPSFQPAVDPIDPNGRTGVELLATYRRAYALALETGPQAKAWQDNEPLVRACDASGLTLDQLAVLLTRIGCAHGASESGTELDVATARAEGEAKIADVIPKIDAASDALTCQKHVDELALLVAFDAYLTLLDHVPAENRRLVAQYRDALATVLPSITSSNPGATQTADTTATWQ